MKKKKPTVFVTNVIILHSWKLCQVIHRSSRYVLYDRDAATQRL